MEISALVDLALPIDVIMSAASGAETQSLLATSDTPENRSDSGHYDRKLARARVQGQTVSQYSAGDVGSAEAREALQVLLSNNGLASQRLSKSAYGLTLALPDGKIIDCRNPILRTFGIHCGRVADNAYYPCVCGGGGGKSARR